MTPWIMFLRLRWYGFRNDGPDMAHNDPHTWNLPRVTS